MSESVKVCSWCKGKGALYKSVAGRMDVCPSCHGKGNYGYIQTTKPTQPSHYHTGNIDVNKCKHCRGKGTAGGSSYVFEACAYCHGTGKSNVKSLEGVKEMNELIKKVEKWASSKGLDKADSSKQFLKVTEEVGEVAAALARNDQHELKDGIGDVVVTLIILAAQKGLTLEECLQQAYNEIKDRKGSMVNGVFVKEEDL